MAVTEAWPGLVEGAGRMADAARCMSSVEPAHLDDTAISTAMCCGEGHYDAAAPSFCVVRGTSSWPALVVVELEWRRLLAACGAWD